MMTRSTFTRPLLFFAAVCAALAACGADPNLLGGGAQTGQEHGAIAVLPDNNTPAGLQSWSGYPSLWPSANNSQNWLVLKCTYSDDRTTRALPTNLPAAIPDLDTYIRFFLGDAGLGTGNIGDYFHDVTYGATAIKTEIHGWYDAPFASTDAQIQLPNHRPQRVEQCASAVPASAGINFSQYDGIVIVTNKSEDGGAGYIGKGPLHINGKTYNMGALTFDSYSMYTTFAAHEMGHGIGLPHSFDNTNSICYGGGPGEYCDPFDIMSGPYRFTSPNYPGEADHLGQPAAGSGINLPNLLRLSAVPSNRLTTYPIGGAHQTFTLTALSHPSSANPLGLQIVNPENPNDVFTLEYRQADGWDQGFPVNSVLIHEYRAGSFPFSYLQEGPAAGGWTVGTSFSNSDQTFTVHVLSIDTTNATATVSIIPPPLCPPGQKFCSLSGQCIPVGMVCRRPCPIGYNDCGDSCVKPPHVCI